MPVCHFIIHAYRSWTEDNQKGYVQRGQPGVQPPHERLARHRAKIAKAPPVLFDDGQKELLIDCSQSICGDFNWRLHAAAATPTHLHLLISWKDARPQGEIMTLLKRKLGNRLSKQKGTTGNRWFSRGGDEKPVTDQMHFDHLCTEYLPDHVNQNGIFWREENRSSTA